MRVFFNGVTNVEGALCLDIAHVRTLSECDTVHYIVRLVVNQFQFDMFLVASHHFACTVVIYMMRTENRLHIVRAERIELLQVTEEPGRNIPEINFSIDVDYRTGLFGQDMLRNEVLEPLGESLHILYFHG